MLRTQKQYKMKPINENLYASYTIVGCGWTLTRTRLKDAIADFKRIAGYAQLRGNKHDGTLAILDTKA